MIKWIKNDYYNSQYSRNVMYYYNDYLFEITISFMDNLSSDNTILLRMVRKGLSYRNPIFDSEHQNIESAMKSAKETYITHYIFNKEHNI